MHIRQPVAVKFILTETAKQQLVAEQRRQVDRVMMELEQIEEQGKQALEQAMAQGGDDAAQQVQSRLEHEKNVRMQQREQFIQQMQQIQQMDLGSEVQSMQVETTIEVKVGDDWTKILRGSEIVVKDGIIQEIRRGGESVSE